MKRPIEFSNIIRIKMVLIQQFRAQGWITPLKIWAAPL